MNAPYSFNFKYDPILENPFRSEIDYNKEIDERVRQLQLMKDKYNSTVKQTIQSESLWNKIDNEIKSLNDDQRNIPFINKAIALDKDDINEFKEMLSKIQQ